jgi:hypothetical protein
VFRAWSLRLQINLPGQFSRPFLVPLGRTAIAACGGAGEENLNTVLSGQ